MSDGEKDRLFEALRACGGTPSPSLNTPSASHGPARMWREPNPCRPRPEHGSNHTVAQHPEIYTEITFTFNRLPFWAQGRRCNVLLHICCNDPLHPYSAATARRPHPRRPAGVRHSRPYPFVWTIKRPPGGRRCLPNPSGGPGRRAPGAPQEQLWHRTC